MLTLAQLIQCTPAASLLCQLPFWITPAASGTPQLMMPTPAIVHDAKYSSHRRQVPPAATVSLNASSLASLNLPSTFDCHHQIMQ
jgi:hypothetical protein